MDELTINAREKDYAASNLIDIMANQFIGCPLSRPIVPRDPNPGDRELSLALDLVSSPTLTTSYSVSPKAHISAYNARHRAQRLMDEQDRGYDTDGFLEQPIPLDLSFDEVFSHILDRSKVDLFASIIGLANCFESTSSPRHRAGRNYSASTPSPRHHVHILHSHSPPQVMTQQTPLSQN